VVGVVTVLRIVWYGVRVRVGQEIWFFSRTVQTGCGAHQDFCSAGTILFSEGNAVVA
jgi:hypothetical protein